MLYYEFFVKGTFTLHYLLKSLYLSLSLLLSSASLCFIARIGPYV